MLPFRFLSLFPTFVGSTFLAQLATLRKHLAQIIYNKLVTEVNFFERMFARVIAGQDIANRSDSIFAKYRLWLWLK